VSRCRQSVIQYRAIEKVPRDVVDGFHEVVHVDTDGGPVEYVSPVQRDRVVVDLREGSDVGEVGYGQRADEVVGDDLGWAVVDHRLGQI